MMKAPLEPLTYLLTYLLTHLLAYSTRLLLACGELSTLTLILALTLALTLTLTLAPP